MALGPQQQPASLGQAAFPKMGAQVHLPKGKEEEEQRIPLENVKAVEKLFSSVTKNEEGTGIP